MSTFLAHSQQHTPPLPLLSTLKVQYCAPSPSIVRTEQRVAEQSFCRFAAVFDAFPFNYESVRVTCAIATARTEVARPGTANRDRPWIHPRVWHQLSATGSLQLVGGSLREMMLGMG